MKRVLHCIVATIMFLFCAASPARAEVKEVKIGGAIDLDMIWANNISDSNNNLKDQPAFSELQVNTTLEAKFTDKVSANINLEYEYAEQYQFADRDNIGLDIAEAYITAEEFLWDRLTFQIGKMGLYYSIAPDLTHLRGGSLLYVTEYTLATRLQIVFENWQIHLWTAKNVENTPNTGYATGNSEDEDYYGIHLEYTWKEKNLLAGNIVYVNNNNIRTREIDYRGNEQHADMNYAVADIGMILYIRENFQWYWQLGYEFGTEAKWHDVVAPEPDDRHLRAFAALTGIDYTFEHNWKPYLDGEIVFLDGNKGGDFDDDAGWHPLDSDFRRTLIVETAQNDRGEGYETFLVKDTAYWSPRAMGGLRGLKLADREFIIDFVLAYFEDTAETAQDAFGDGIGWELDAMFTWNYTADLSFGLGLGYWFVDDDFAENRARNANVPSDDAWLVYFNTTIIF